MRGRARDLDAFLRRHLLVLAVLTVVTAVFSYAGFHEDEICQTQEFALAKLGVRSSSGLAWEYGAAIRPWLQPALYVLVGRAALSFGLRDPYDLALLFRLATAIPFVGAVAAFVTLAREWAATPGERRAFVITATLAGFLPYLAVRTSSETLAAAAFTLGFVLLVGGRAPAAKAADTAPLRVSFAGGLLLGVAFEARFQSALLAAGLVLWLLVVARARAREVVAIALGALSVVGVCVFIDAWGYGRYVFPPIRYFEANAVQGVASTFGTMPVYGYFYASVANVFAPVVALLLAAMVVAWYRHPAHVLTWTTLPFFVAHSLIPHKEERFLFPMVILSLASPLLAATSGSARLPLLSQRIRAVVRARAFVVLVALSNAAPCAVLLVYPLGWHHHFAFDRFVHERLKRLGEDNLHGLFLGEAPTAPPPYTSAPYDLSSTTVALLHERLAKGERGTLLVADSPRMQTGDTLVDEGAELLYTECPFPPQSRLTSAILLLVGRYNAWRREPLHPVAWRSLYRLR